MECQSYPSIIPTSFRELNSYLENCQTANDIHIEAFKLFTKISISLDNFIFVLGPTIFSYPDVNDDNLSLFSRKLEKLFPDGDRSEEDKKTMIAFWQQIKQNKNKRPEAEPERIYTGSYLCNNSNNNQRFVLSLNEILENQIEVLHTAPAERLKEIQLLYPNKPCDYFEEARRLNTILSLLHVEVRLMKQMAVSNGLLLDIIRAKDIYFEGLETFPVTPFHEIALFEIPGTFENPEEFSFWIQLACFLEIHQKEDKIQVFIKPSNANIDETTYSLLKNCNSLKPMRKAKKQKF